LEGRGEFGRGEALGLSSGIRWNRFGGGAWDVEVFRMRSRNSTLWAVLGGLSCICVGSPALAQGGQPFSIVDSPNIDQTASRLRINATVEGAYESNVAGGDAQVAAERGLKPQDFMITPTVLVDVLRPIGPESVFLQGSAGYSFYDRNSVLNRENLNLTGGLNARLGTCRGTATARISRYQDQLQNVTRTEVKDVYDLYSVGLDAICGRPIGLSPILSVTQSWANNSNTELSTSDNQTFGVSAGVAYQTPTFGKLSLFGQYQTTTFNNRFVLVNSQPVQDGYDTYGGWIRYQRLLGARIQGTASVGYTSLKPAIAGTPGFDGFTYDADLTFRAGGRLGLHAGFNRDVEPSNVLDATYGLEIRSLVEATYDLGARLKLNLGVSETTRRFQGLSLLTGVDLTKDDTKSIYATATYKLNKLFVALNVRNDERIANVAAFSYSDTRVGLTVGTAY
jgi:hypothetical protein